LAQVENYNYDGTPVTTQGDTGAMEYDTDKFDVLEFGLDLFQQGLGHPANKANVNMGFGDYVYGSHHPFEHQSTFGPEVNEEYDFS
jgi:hypothetical protein